MGAAKVVRGSQRFFASMGQIIKIHYSSFVGLLSSANTIIDSIRLLSVRHSPFLVQQQATQAAARE